MARTAVKSRGRSRPVRRRGMSTPTKVLLIVGGIFFGLPLLATFGGAFLSSFVQLNGPAADSLTCPYPKVGPVGICPANENQDARNRATRSTATTDAPTPTNPVEPPPRTPWPAVGKVRPLPSELPALPPSTGGGSDLPQLGEGGGGGSNLPQLGDGEGVLGGLKELVAGAG